MAQKIVLFYADWCGFCKKIKASGGTWDQIKKAANVRGIPTEEVDIDQNPNHKYANKQSSGVPQIAVVLNSGDVKWHVGYTDNPNTVLKLIPGLLGARGSGNRRRSLKSIACPMNGPSIKDLLWHVIEHCGHLTCKTNPVAALKCGEKCCL